MCMRKRYYPWVEMDMARLECDIQVNSPCFRLLQSRRGVNVRESEFLDFLDSSGCLFRQSLSTPNPMGFSTDFSGYYWTLLQNLWTPLLLAARSHTCTPFPWKTSKIVASCILLISSTLYLFKLCSRYFYPGSWPSACYYSDN